MKKEILSTVLASGLLMGAVACGDASPEPTHAQAVATAHSDAANRVKEALSVYHAQYLPYLGRLGLPCVNALNEASLQDDADADTGSDNFTKETGAALIAPDCPPALTPTDRTALYKSYHAEVGDPLRDLIKEDALEDGTLSESEISAYRSALQTAYLQGNVSNVDSGEYIFPPDN